MTLFEIILTLSDLSSQELKAIRLRIHESTFYRLVDERDSHGNQIWKPNGVVPTCYGVVAEVITDDEPEGILVEVPENLNETEVSYVARDMLVTSWK